MDVKVLDHLCLPLVAPDGRPEQARSAAPGPGRLSRWWSGDPPAHVLQAPCWRAAPGRRVGRWKVARRWSVVPRRSAATPGPCRGPRHWRQRRRPGSSRRPPRPHRRHPPAPGTPPNPSDVRDRPPGRPARPGTTRHGPPRWHPARPPHPGPGHQPLQPSPSPPGRRRRPCQGRGRGRPRRHRWWPLPGRPPATPGRAAARGGGGHPADRQCGHQRGRGRLDRQELAGHGGPPGGEGGGL
jgi:hypothetical protein